LLRCDVPIYEYECSACHSSFERRQRFDEEPIAACPDCEGKARRVIHSVPVLFKGSGFYCTDNGSRSSNNPSRKDEDTSEKPKVEKEAKAEAKAEAKVGAEPKETG
jgi:putative FmdB family regulatory protein